MKKLLKLSPEDIVLSDEKQQEIRESDCFGGKKCIVYNENEQFKIYKNNPDYVIGTSGTVYSLSKNKKLNISVNKDGYEATSIEGKPYMVHRLVLETYNPIENSDQFQVTHLDYNKTNNSKTNLAWLSPQQIIQRAIENGHRFPAGENHHKAIYTESQIYKVCELISKGYTGRQIAEEMNIEYTPRFQDLTTKIKLGRSWKHISDQFPEIQLRSKKKKED